MFEKTYQSSIFAVVLVSMKKGVPVSMWFLIRDSAFQYVLIFKTIIAAHLHDFLPGPQVL